MCSLLSRSCCQRLNSKPSVKYELTLFAWWTKLKWVLLCTHNKINSKNTVYLLWFYCGWYHEQWCRLCCYRLVLAGQCVIVNWSDIHPLKGILRSTVFFLFLVIRVTEYKYLAWIQFYFCTLLDQILISDLDLDVFNSPTNYLHFYTNHMILSNIMHCCRLYYPQVYKVLSSPSICHDIKVLLTCASVSPPV